MEWWIQQGAKEVTIDPVGYGWVSNGRYNGRYYSVLMTDDDMNNERWHKAVYIYR